jgi:hypothetical protein
MNHYVYTRIAEQRLEQTARQARTAWWRAQAPAAMQNSHAPAKTTRLDWAVPATTRIAGA